MVIQYSVLPIYIIAKNVYTYFLFAINVWNHFLSPKMSNLASGKDSKHDLKTFKVKIYLRGLCEQRNLSSVRFWKLFSVNDGSVANDCLTMDLLQKLKMEYMISNFMLDKNKFTVHNCNSSSFRKQLLRTD